MNIIGDFMLIEIHANNQKATQIMDNVNLFNVLFWFLKNTNIHHEIFLLSKNNKIKDNNVLHIYAY